MTGNCLGWVGYAAVTKDLFVLFSNAPGLVLSIWLNMGAAKLQYQEMHQLCLNNGSHSLLLHSEVDGEDEEEEEDIAQDIDENDGALRRSRFTTNNGTAAIASLPSFTSHEKWVICILIIWTIVLSAVCFIPMSNKEQADIIGLVVNINLVVFYGAPLSTILHVVSTRNSASIHRRTMIMSLFNSFFWLAYGIALMDIIILLPNACGFALGIVQLLLCTIFSDKVEDDSHDDGAEENLFDLGRVSAEGTAIV
jgi:solute carrier family 50 protein (sugar transporter)